MRLSGFSVALFAAAFVLHWLCLRIFVPRRELHFLLVLFFAVLMAGFTVLPHLPGLDVLTPAGPWEFVHVSLFYTAMTLAYAVTYCAIVDSSPTLTLLLFLDKAGNIGRSREELASLFSNDLIIGPRFQNMLRSGLIRKAGLVFQLTDKGKCWAQFFRFFRWLFRLKKGG